MPCDCDNQTSKFHFPSLIKSHDNSFREWQKPGTGKFKLRSKQGENIEISRARKDEPLPWHRNGVSFRSRVAAISAIRPAICRPTCPFRLGSFFPFDGILFPSSFLCRSPSDLFDRSSNNLSPPGVTPSANESSWCTRPRNSRPSAPVNS